MKKMEKDYEIHGKKHPALITIFSMNETPNGNLNKKTIVNEAKIIVVRVILQFKYNLNLRPSLSTMPTKKN